MHQLQSIVNSDMKEGSEGCPQHMVWPFFTAMLPDFPTVELKSPSSCQPRSA